MLRDMVWFGERLVYTSYSDRGGLYHTYPNPILATRRIHSMIKKLLAVTGPILYIEFIFHDSSHSCHDSRVRR
jgi:hypothetical protein